MMCQRIGLPPISTIGFGRTALSSVSRSRIRARMTAFKPASRSLVPSFPVDRGSRCRTGRARRPRRIVRMRAAVGEDRNGSLIPFSAVPDVRAG